MDYKKLTNRARKLRRDTFLAFIEKGEELHFIGDDNFRAIARYNISDVYAMAVYYLAEEFKK